MLRILLIAVFVFQSLQLGWANAHVTAEAAQAVVHGHAPALATALEIAPSCDHCLVDGKTHACQDNHAHHTTVVGLGAESFLWLQASAAGLSASSGAEHLPSGSLSRIERPKWATTTPVVVNL